MALTQISTDGVKNDAISHNKIPANAIQASELADNAVDTAAIADDAVTAAKIADTSITSGQLADDSVITSKIAAGAVNDGKLASNAVTGAKIAANAINNANKIQDSIITGAKIGSGTITDGNLATNSVTTGKIANDAVTVDKVADDAIGIAQLSASGTASSSTFLRGDNAWTAVTSTTINNNADNRVITGSGTANTLNGESNVIIDSSGRVLIGTDTVGDANGDDLTVAASGHSGITIRSGTSSTSQLMFTDSTSGAGSYTGIVAYRHASDSMGLFTNTAERLTITSAGNVGIGNDASFPVYTHANARNFIIGHGGESTALQIHSGTSNYGGIYFGDVADRTDSNSYIGGIEYKHQDNWMNVRVNGSERMRVHATGQVSIGHNSFTSQTHPAKLVVHPNIHDSSTQAIGILVDGDSGTGGGASQPSIGIKCVNTNTWNNATHQYGIYNDVGQQYTASGTGIYNRTQGLYGTTKASYIELNKNLNAYTNGICLSMNLKPSGSGGTAYFVEAMKDDSHLKWRVLQNGNLQNANNSYGSTSDVKLKENIVDAKSQWNDIKALKIRNFNFKDDPDKVKMLGVVAQEAEAVSAGLVESENDIEMDEATGKGKVIGTTKFVKYSILYMKAVKALQEAMTKIEVLETKVAALESA